MKISTTKKVNKKVDKKVAAKQAKSTAIEIAKTFKVSNVSLLDIADEGKDEDCPQCGLELTNGFSCPQCGAVSDDSDDLIEDVLEQPDEPFDDSEPFNDLVDDEMSVDGLDIKEEILSLFREYGWDYNDFMKNPSPALIPEEVKKSIEEIISRQGMENLSPVIQEGIIPAIRFSRKDKKEWRFSVPKLYQGYEQRYNLLEKTGEFLKDKFNYRLGSEFKHIPQAKLKRYLEGKLKTDNNGNVEGKSINNYISLLVTNKENLIQIEDRVFHFDEIFTSEGQIRESNQLNKQALSVKIKDLIEDEDKSKPLSDYDIAKRLNSSEPTVRNIRNILLKIPSSKKRKKAQKG